MIRWKSLSHIISLATHTIDILYEKAELISIYHFLSSTCLVLMGSLNRKTLFTLIKASIKHSNSNMHI